MHARAHLHQCCHAAAQTHRAGRRGRDARDQLERRALAGTVRADHREALPLLHLEAHVLQGERAGLVRAAPVRRARARFPIDDEVVSKRRVARTSGPAPRVALAHLFEPDRRLDIQITSAKLGSSRLNRR